MIQVSTPPIALHTQTASTVDKNLSGNQPRRGEALVESAFTFLLSGD